MLSAAGYGVSDQRLQTRSTLRRRSYQAGWANGRYLAITPGVETDFGTIECDILDLEPALQGAERRTITSLYWCTSDIVGRDRDARLGFRRVRSGLSPCGSSTSR